MEQPPALTPQEVSNMQQHQLGQPQTVKIFGIMHLVFAGFGVLGLIWGIATLAFDMPANPFIPAPRTPQMVQQAQMQAAMQEKLMPMTLITNAISVVVIALMTIAGIQLLKKRRGGLKWSNRYAIASLIAKVIAIVLTFIYMLPAMKEMMENMPGSSGMGPAADIMVPAMIGGVIIGSLVSCAYPVIVLILLNRPNTKQWFAAQPE